MYSISVLGTKDQAEGFIKMMTQQAGTKAVMADHLLTLGFASATIVYNGETYLLQYFSSSPAYQKTRETGIKNADLCILCNADASTIKLLAVTDPLKQTPAVSFEPGSEIDYWDAIKRNGDNYRHNNQDQSEKKTVPQVSLFKLAAVTPTAERTHKQPAINSSGEAVFASIPSNSL
jgi:hypothetical protein